MPSLRDAPRAWLGDLVLVLSTQPSLLLSDQPNHQQSLQIPLDRLAMPELVLRRALALRLGPELSLASVLAEFLDTLTTVRHTKLATRQAQPCRCG